jgi:hypothetical protein
MSDVPDWWRKTPIPPAEPKPEGKMYILEMHQTLAQIQDDLASLSGEFMSDRARDLLEEIREKVRKVVAI